VKGIKSFVGALAVLSSLGYVSAANAEDSSNFYLGAGYSQFDDGDGLKPTVAFAIAGVPLTKNWAIEGRFGAGVNEDSNGFISAKIKSYYGAFVRGSLPAGDAVNFYGILGYGTGEAEASGFGFTASASESSEAYGIGAELNFGSTKAHHLGAEWARYFKDTNAISLIYRFNF